MSSVPGVSCERRTLKSQQLNEHQPALEKYSLSVLIISRTPFMDLIHGGGGRIQSCP